MNAEDLVPGAKYAVTWQDCCTNGRFTSTLTSRITADVPPEHEDYGFVEALNFDNGVTLETPFYATTFEAVPA